MILLQHLQYFLISETVSLLVLGSRALAGVLSPLLASFKMALQLFHWLFEEVLLNCGCVNWWGNRI